MQDLVESEPENDEEQNKYLNSILKDQNNLTIGPVDGLTEEEQLKKWKLKAHHMNENIKKLRYRNNLKRDKLKKLGETAEKLVQANVRKQEKSEKRATGTNYLDEQKIVKLILEKKATKEQFKDKINEGVLERLLDLNSQEQKNSEMRRQLQVLKQKAQNLNFVDQLNQLKNELVHIQNQTTEQKNQNDRVKILNKDQELQIAQMTKTFEYSAKIADLVKETNDIKADLKQKGKQELVHQKLEQKQSVYLNALQKVYREAAKKLGISDEYTEILDMGERRKSPLQSQKKQYQEMVQKQLKEKQPETDQSKIIAEYNSKPEEKFQEVQQSLVELAKALKESQNKFQKKKLEDEQQLLKLHDDSAQLQKQLRLQEHDTKIQMTKLLDLQRQVQLAKDQIKNAESALKKSSDDALTKRFQQNSKPQTFGRQNLDGSAIVFDDSKLLNYGPIVPISRVKIYYNSKDQIIGIQGYYGDKAGSLNLHASMLKADYKELIIPPEDQLAYIFGAYNHEQIVFLRFETVNKLFIQVGTAGGRDCQDFKIQVKDQEAIGLIGAMDFTEQSQNPTEIFLVQLGLKIKPKMLDILQRKKQKKEEEKLVKPQFLMRRHVINKQNFNVNVKLVQSQPKLGSLDDSSMHAQFVKSEKYRYEAIKLGLADNKKIFTPQDYKSPSYKEEEQKRRELSQKRKERVEKFRQETQSTKLLPTLAQDPKNASPPKNVKQDPKAKKDDKKATKDNKKANKK